MRNKIILVLLFALLIVSPAYALQIEEQEVNVTLSQSIASKYIWRGMDLFADNDAALFSSVDVALPGLIKETDISMNVWGAFPMDNGHETSTELDYSLTASHDFESFNISSGYVYFDYPKANNLSDINEFWGSFSLFKIPALPFDMSFTVFAAYETEAKDGGAENGWYYSWGFGMDVPLPESQLTQEGQAASIGITNWGNDGVGGLKPSVLYATECSLSTSYTVNSFSFTPSLNYAINYEDAINKDDEFWAGIDVSYSF